MRLLLDTNVVLRLANREAPEHALLRECIDGAALAGDELCVTAQVVFEFWVVATRPISNNGLGLSVEAARDKVDLMLATFPLLPDPPDLVQRWLDLCTRYAVCGRAAHDARLVACMLAANVSDLVTLNAEDFARHPDVRCVVPK
jgi:predicted nucleic acid-binding protein